MSFLNSLPEFCNRCEALYPVLHRWPYLPQIWLRWCHCHLLLSPSCYTPQLIWSGLWCRNISNPCRSKLLVWYGTTGSSASTFNNVDPGGRIHSVVNSVFWLSPSGQLRCGMQRRWWEFLSCDPELVQFGACWRETWKPSVRVDEAMSAVPWLVVGVILGLPDLLSLFLGFSCKTLSGHHGCIRLDDRYGWLVGWSWPQPPELHSPDTPFYIALPHWWSKTPEHKIRCCLSFSSLLSFLLGTDWVSAQRSVFSLVTIKVLSLAAGIAQGHFVSLPTDRILLFYHLSGSQSRVWHWICKHDWHQSPDHCHQKIHPRYHPSLHLFVIQVSFVISVFTFLLGKPPVLWPPTESCHLSHTPPGGS